MKFNWEQIDTDDFTAREGDYILRAEQMDKRHWWWCVYFRNETIDSSMLSEKPATTKEQALKAAEKCYKKHVKNKK